MTAPRYEVEGGKPHPLGPTPDERGVNFSLFSEHATSVELLLFDRHDDPEPVQVIKLDPAINRTFHFWHIHVMALEPGMHYAYRVDGPRDPRNGHRFDPEKALIDPYARGVTKNLWKRGDACLPGDNLAASMRNVVIDTSDYDWEGDLPLNRPMCETIVYEMHVAGFTKSSSSGVKHPGSFSAITEKIPYLKELGVTAIELLPVFEFDDTESRNFNGRSLKNYWGYSTIGFFAPHSSYCVSPEEGTHVREFRDMVKALHRAGIEVFLDVVFNHTDEGNHEGPVFSFKGINNSVYYHLSPEDKQYYYDYTGCGNTFNCNHPMGEKFILDCLKFWAKEMHIDGFRFDEASVLSRGEDGNPMKHPPVLWQIELDEDLANTKVIAEAWDAAGLYQVGYFPGYRWAEWNGRYRDTIRRFIKGDKGLIGELASRITGSADIYQASGELPINSINFITAHDGFSLNDLVSYNHKRNDANGEGNQDGVDDNLSWNCGAEGATDDPQIEELRERQIKNFGVILLLSQGIPMMVMGDEARRTQEGNNNAYCQDNEISWLDWSLAEKNRHILRFWKLMIAFRKRHSNIHRSRYFTGIVNERGLKDISWHGCKLDSPNWDDPNALAIAYTLGGFHGEADIHVMANMCEEELDFEIPPIQGRNWYRSVDTARSSPEDIAEPGEEKQETRDAYPVQGRSVVVLISK